MLGVDIAGRILAPFFGSFHFITDYWGIIPIWRVEEDKSWVPEFLPEYSATVCKHTWFCHHLNLVLALTQLSSQGSIMLIDTFLPHLIFIITIFFFCCILFYFTKEAVIKENGGFHILIFMGAALDSINFTFNPDCIPLLCSIRLRAYKSGCKRFEDPGSSLTLTQSSWLSLDRITLPSYLIVI